MTPPTPLLHEDVRALADSRLAGRRWIDPAAGRQFHATMRNDFLTPRGKTYKWQEMAANFERTVVGGRVPTVVPVEYRWQRVDARTSTPEAAGEWREWTFARGQSFKSTLLHTELDGPAPAAEDPDGAPPPAMDLGYRLPKSPAVDLLLMLSWDVVAMEMLCTHLTTTPDLSDVGGHAELERLSGSWAQFEFSDPGVVAMFRNSRTSGRHLGYGRFDGRPTAVYSAQCMDSVLDVKSGPMSQRGRSSYWATVQVDIETRDLLAVDMTEVIIATLTGGDGRRVPIQKRRAVRIWAGAEGPLEDAVRSAEPAARRTASAVGPADAADAAALAEAIGLAGRVEDDLAWQVASLEKLPQGMSELALMGFRSVVGTDLADTYRQVSPLASDLRAVVEGRPGAQAGLREALPLYRRHLEGLLAFGQIAVDGANRHTALDQGGRDAARSHLTSVGSDLGELLALLDRWERPGRHGPPGSAGGASSPPRPPSAGVVHPVTDRDLPEQP